MNAIGKAWSSYTTTSILLAILEPFSVWVRMLSLIVITIRISDSNAATADDKSKLVESKDIDSKKY